MDISKFDELSWEEVSFEQKSGYYGVTYSVGENKKGAPYLRLSFVGQLVEEARWKDVSKVLVFVAVDNSGPAPRRILKIIPGAANSKVAAPLIAGLKDSKRLRIDNRNWIPEGVKSTAASVKHEVDGASQSIFIHLPAIFVRDLTSVATIETSNTTEEDTKPTVSSFAAPEEKSVSEPPKKSEKSKGLESLGKVLYKEKSPLNKILGQARFASLDPRVEGDILRVGENKGVKLEPPIWVSAVKALVDEQLNGNLFKMNDFRIQLKSMGFSARQLGTVNNEQLLTMFNSFFSVVDLKLFSAEHDYLYISSN